MRTATISLFTLWCVGCSLPSDTQKEVKNYNLDTLAQEQFVDPSEISIDTSVFRGFVAADFEKGLVAGGLVDVHQLDSTIVVDLRYATSANFLGVQVYQEFNKCYLQPDVAEKLKLAQLFLRSKVPSYSLLVYDAARPRSVQQKMWDALQIPNSQKPKYVSNPKNGSLHNFGAAVDISIIDNYGEELDMGTPYDYFGTLAYPRKEKEMLEQGKLTKAQVNNREFLRNIMKKAGFTPITTEWWHFNACSRKEAKSRYRIIE